MLARSGLNFVGNVEANDLPMGAVEVAVCDGFVGNILMKLIEGRGGAMANRLRSQRDGVVAVDDLKEVSMGNWEGLTTTEIAERWPKELETIFREGVDLRRGETGESWGELTSRVSNAVRGLKHAADEPTIVVAHGGAIRAYISSLTLTSDTHAESLFTPANTSVSHVAKTERGPEILDYAVATHLESLE